MTIIFLLTAKSPRVLVFFSGAKHPADYQMHGQLFQNSPRISKNDNSTAQAVLQKKYMLKSFLQIHPLLDSAAGIPTHNFKKYRDLSNHLQKKNCGIFRLTWSDAMFVPSLIYWNLWFIGIRCVPQKKMVGKGRTLSIKKRTNHFQVMVVEEKCPE